MRNISNRPFSKASKPWPLSLRLASSAAAAFASVVSLSLWPLSLPKGAGTTTYQVAIENMKFSPDALKIHVGDQITFKNQDLVPHTVTKIGVLDSGMIKVGESWSYTAMKEGTIHYACSYHPVMEGTIEVAKE